MKISLPSVRPNPETASPDASQQTSLRDSSLNNAPSLPASDRRDFLRQIAAAAVVAASPFAGVNQQASGAAPVQDQKASGIILKTPAAFSGAQLSEVAARLIEKGELNGEAAKALLLYQSVRNGRELAGPTLYKAVGDNKANPLDKSQIGPIARAIVTLDGGKLQSNRHSADFNAALAKQEAGVKLANNEMQVIAAEYNKLFATPIQKFTNIAPMQVPVPEVSAFKEVLEFAKKHGNQVEAGKLESIKNHPGRWSMGEKVTYLSAVAALNEAHKGKASQAELQSKASVNYRFAQQMYIGATALVESIGDPKVKEPLKDMVLAGNVRLHAKGADSPEVIMEAISVFAKVESELLRIRSPHANKEPKNVR